jgi:hypothetical protein
MKKLEKAICLAAFCAVDPNNSADDFDRLLAALKSERIPLDLLEDLLRTMDEPQLLRRMARSHSAAPIDWSEIRVDAEGTVYWREQDIGEVHVFHKTIFPQETQARIAYEVFLDRFLEYVQREYKIALLRQEDADVKLFVPQDVDFELKTAWDDFVEYSFTGHALRTGFVRLVSSISLANRGVSTLNVPIVNSQQAKVLAAFYRANLARVERGEDRRRQEITKLESELEKGSEDQKKTKRDIARLKKELATWEERYAEAHKLLRDLSQEHPDWLREIESIARQYMTGEAPRQLALRGDITAKAAREMKRLAELEDFYELPSFLSEEAIPFSIRKGGDNVRGICYACGRVLREGHYDARKFIFESPSQRPQSAGSEKRPRVCGTCALVSLASPLKTGSDRLIVRLRHPDIAGGSYLLEDQLRMLMMGELNIVAGRYALVQVTEQISRRGGKEPLPNMLGQKQYALYKIATLFPPEVFRFYEIEAFIGSSVVSLLGRLLTILGGLFNVFGLDSRSWWSEQRGKLVNPISQAIRYVQKEEVISGIYTLIRGGLLRNNLGFNSAQGSQLETLYEEYWRWLMKEKPTEAQRFRDVTAMTGLLYAFCTYTRSEVRKAGGNVRIEVRKLIERATDPFGFTYTAAGNTKSERAMLYRNADIYFCFDRARDLLEEIGIDATEREGTNEKGTSTLILYFDDVTNAYTHLFENRYATPKEQRDFTNVLRMSLHSRFPELMEREKGE